MKRAILMLGLSALTLASVLAQTSRPLDFTNFVVVGEGLAAGYANFSLIETNQTNSFPAVMARQMKVANFPQPLIQAPGLGNISGFPGLPARVPGTLQTTVRVPGGPKPLGRVNAQPPFALFVFNVSVPGNKLVDTMTRRPSLPLVQTNDPQQTLVNMILGFPGMVAGVNKPLWTQAEYAQQMNPSFAVIAVGYYDFVDALARGDASLLPDQALFKTRFTTLVQSVPGPGVPVVVATIPDPMDSGYTVSIDSAAASLTLTSAALQQAYKLKADDRISIPGLMVMGSQLLAGTPGVLPDGSIISAALASQVTARVRAVNSDIVALAQQVKAPLVDIQAVFSRARTNGVAAGARILTADFQGGLYSFDGFYPGATMHAVLANEFLTVINKAYGTSYPLVDLAVTSAADPVVRMIPMSRRPRTGFSEGR